MVEIFSGLASMPCLKTIKPSSIPLGTPKTHFSGLSLLPFAQSFVKVGYDLVSPFEFDHDVIHVGLNGLLDEVPKTLEHATLVRSHHVLQAERHCDVVV